MLGTERKPRCLGFLSNDFNHTSPEIRDKRHSTYRSIKEDCPDLGNSCIPDIIQELKQYGCEVLVQDPYCAPEEAKAEHGVELIENLEIVQKVSAVMFAVAHRPYREWSTSRWKERLTKSGAIVDVKRIVPREITSDFGVSLWRL
jgi:UDP-N-acetyl-D-galactosamine dehydrogenase